MASLENVYHDFPRLAKQSGFHFRLHGGRVNWAEIDNLNIEEITEKRNFQLLERNLLNVINCNLEREYDLKILDQNFVKLFKLAQLGVDYLFYCEMYLDRCVVLLQEQLITLQQECDSLKEGNYKMKEELNKNNRKIAVQNYQCKKCEKVFISDIYLKYHDKRRHSTPEITERSHKKSIDNSQQTEDERKLSASTQTLFLNEVTTATQTEDESSIKMPLVMKIENLEQELKDLKNRLKKAESTLSEKTETAKSSEYHSFNVPGSVHCNSMLMLLPSCLTKSGNFYEINPRCQIPVPEVSQINDSTSPPSVRSETVESKIAAENLSQINTKLEETYETESELVKNNRKSITPAESIKSFQDYQSEGKNSEYDKENIDPSVKTNITGNVTKPLPPPRRSKKNIRAQTESIQDKIMVEPLIKAESLDTEEKLVFSNDLMLAKSSPLKEKPDGETISDIFEGSRENFSELNTPIANSNDSLFSKKSISVEPESKSFIKKIVTRNSPKLQKLGKNIRKSLSNLYDSVFVTEKDSSNQDLRKTAVTDVLNDQLRRLGVDPEWSEIPRKTMKQKLNALKHRKKLLSKENPTYPAVRQNTEKKLFQKLQQNLKKKKAVLINKLNNQECLPNKNSAVQESSEEAEASENYFKFVKRKSPAMYEIETDSDSQNSDLENSSDQDPEILKKNVIVEELISSGETEEKVDTNKYKEFDISVFQIGRGNLGDETETNSQKNASVNKTEEALTDSNSENFLDFCNKNSITSTKEYLGNESHNEKAGHYKIYDDKAQKFEFLYSEKAKAENSTIFKEKNALQPKITMNTKKRVFFANYPNNSEEELSDSPTDDDLWSFKSKWSKEAS